MLDTKPTILIDSHCHLQSIDLADFNNMLDDVLDKANENGVKKLLSVCVELSDLPKLEQIANRYPNVYTSVGIHPNVTDTNELNANELMALSSHPACIAIGETGLDYYRTETEEAKILQRQRFCAHIEAARKSQKPLIIHTREAAEDTIAYMTSENASEIGGVMHCFSENWEIAKQALDLNFYISFSGILTFKNAHQLHDVAKKVPIDRILIETDSPYLAPVPFRGKQNHPALVKHVAMALSTLRQTDYDTIACETTANFYRCFRIQP